MFGGEGGAVKVKKGPWGAPQGHLSLLFLRCERRPGLPLGGRAGRLSSGGGSSHGGEGRRLGRGRSCLCAGVC